MNPAPLQTLYCAYAISSAVCLSGVVCVCLCLSVQRFIFGQKPFFHPFRGRIRSKTNLSEKKRVSRQPKTGANITILVQSVFSNKFNILVVFRVARRYWRFASLFKFNFSTILSMRVFFLKIQIILCQFFSINLSRVHVKPYNKKLTFIEYNQDKQV